MGYTHYFNVKAELDQKVWDKFIREAKTLLKALPKTVTLKQFDYQRYSDDRDKGIELPREDYRSEVEQPVALVGENSKGKPVLDANCVFFNGAEPLSFEDFYISRTTPDSSYVKTERRPYDLAVCVVLLSLAHHFPDQVHVSSDGNLNDWKAAFELYQTVTGRKAPYTGVDGEEMTRLIRAKLEEGVQEALAVLARRIEDPEARTRLNEAFTTSFHHLNDRGGALDEYGWRRALKDHLKPSAA